MSRKSPSDNIGERDERRYKEAKDPGLNDYFKEIGNFRGLSRDEEVELARQIDENDSPEKQKFIKANLRLVVAVANKYKNNKVPLADLIQEGNLGLLRAVEKFDPERGVKFSAYASWWVKQAIMKVVSNDSRSIYIPSNVNTEINRIKKIQQRHLTEFGREPIAEEIAEIMHTDVKYVRKLLEYPINVSSLDIPLAEGAREAIKDLIKDENVVPPDDFIEAKNAVKIVRDLLKHLTDKERKVIRMRYGFDPSGYEYTLVEVGKEFGVTRERIRQIQEKAEGKMLRILLKTELQN